MCVGKSVGKRSKADSIIENDNSAAIHATKRSKTIYPGVYFIRGIVSGQTKPEPIYYIRYRRDSRQIEEKVGSKSIDDMTPARANNIRSERIKGSQPSNKERRETIKAQKQAQVNIWTVDKIWQEYKDTNPKIKGIIFDESRYRKHIMNSLGKKELRDIEPRDIDLIRNKLLKSKSQATTKNVLELIRRISNFAVKRHLCPGLNHTIRMPKVNNIRTEFLNEEELGRLWASINQDTNIQAANLMKLALLTGMRRGELFKLRWKDIDFKRGFILIKDPKGGPNVVIPLNDASRMVLDNHPRDSSPYVFPGRNGNQRTDINHQVNRIKKRARLPKDFRPLHGLRHTYASLLASSGKVDMYVLQKLLTHKSPFMTQRYAHLHDKALMSASSLIGDIVSKVSNHDVID